MSKFNSKVLQELDSTSTNDPDNWLEFNRKKIILETETHNYLLQDPLIAELKKYLNYK